jgi:hypothetical protein
LQLQLVDINHDKYSFPTAVDRQPTWGDRTRGQSKSQGRREAGRVEL